MEEQLESAIRAWAARVIMVAVAMSLAAPVSAQDPVVDPIGADDTSDPTTMAREDTYETTRTAAMGSGSRATAIGTSALATNAANMPLARLYHVESTAATVAGSNNWSLGGAVADSVTNSLAAGMAFRYVLGGDGNRAYSGWDGRLSIGMPLSEAISIGVSGRYVNLSADKKNADGDRIGPRARGFTVDAAVRITLGDRFHIAALGYNLVDRNSELVPMLVGGSLGLNLTDYLSIGADLLTDLTTFEDVEFIAGGGIELLAGEAIPLRLGYRADTGRDRHQLTGSVGYVDQKVGIDFSLRQDISGDDRESALVMSFRYHVQ